jgi:hypothetical protein
MATRNDNNDQNKAEQNKAADEAARTARTVTDLKLSICKKSLLLR